MFKGRILAISDACWSITGYSTQSDKVLSEMVKRGYEVYQFACNYFPNGKEVKDKDGYVIHNGIKCMLLPKIWEGPAHLYASKEEVKEAYDRIKPDIIWTLNDYYRVKDYLELGEEFINKWVHWLPIDNDMPDPLWPPYQKKMKFLIYLTDFGEKMDSPRTGKVHYSKRIYHGLEDDVYFPMPDKQEVKRKHGMNNNFVVLTVGRHQPRKMIYHSANAVCKFLQKHKDATWICKADPNDSAMRDQPENEKDLNKIVASYGVTNQVMFVPNQLSYEDMNDMYNTADISIMLTGGEGFNLPLIESMMAGTPAIVTGSTTGPELTANGKLGFPVKVSPQKKYVDHFKTHYDVADINEAVRDLEICYNDWKKDGKKLKEMSKGCREFAVKNCSLKNIADEWEEVFTRIIRYNNPVLWHCRFGRGVGFTAVSETIIPALEKLGYKIYVNDWDAAKSPIIEPYFKNLYDNFLRDINKIDLETTPQIVCSLMEEYDYVKGDCRIGLAFVESTILRAYCAKQCNTMNYIITSTEHVKNVHKSSGVEVPIYVVPPSIDTKKFPELKRPKTGKRPFTFIHIGVAQDRKNTYQTLEGYVHAFPDDGKTKFILKSNDFGVLDTHFKDAYGHRSDIELLYTTTPMSQEDLLKLFQRADCYVNISHGEGIGMPDLEALATGLPVIGSNWDARNVFLDEEVGWMMKIVGWGQAYAMLPDDSGVWAHYDGQYYIDTLKYVASHPEEAKLKGANGAKRIRDKFTPEQSAEALDKMLMDIYSKNNKQVEEELKTSNLEYVKQPILWNGLFGQGTGVGGVSETIIPELEKLGYDIYINDWYGGKSPILDAGLRKLYDKYLANKDKIDFKRYPQIECYGMRSLDNLSGDCVIGWGFIESNKVGKTIVDAYNKMNYVVTSTKWSKDVKKKSGITIPIYVVPPCVDAMKFPKITRASSDTFVFLNIGDGGERKNQGQMLEGYAKAFPDDGKTKFIFKSNDYGWQDTEVKRKMFIEAYKDRKDIEFVFNTHPMTQEEMLKLYAKADCYVNISHGECIGMTEMEAMSTGLPIIGSNWDGRGAFLDDDVGWMVKIYGFGRAHTYIDEDWGEWAHYDGQDYINILKYVASHPDEAKKKGDIGAERIHRNFTLQKSALAFDKLFRDVSMKYNENEVKEPILWHSMFGTGCGLYNIGENIIPELEKLGHEVYINDEMWGQGKLLKPYLKELTEKTKINKNKIDFKKIPQIKTFGITTFKKLDTENDIGWSFIEADHVSKEVVDRWNTLNYMITSTEWSKQVEIKSGVTIPIHVVSPCIDTNDFPKLERTEERPFTFLHIGAMVPRKNQEQMIEGYVNTFPDDGNTRFIMKSNDWFYRNAGTQIPVKNIMFIDKYKYRKDIGFIFEEIPATPEEMLNLYRSADCYVNISHGEGIGLPDMEALSTGIPVIGNNWDGRSVFLDEDVGWIINISGWSKAYTNYGPDFGEWAEYDAQDYMNTLKYVVEHRDEVKAKGEAGAERIRKKFTPRQSAIQLSNLLKSISGKKVKGVSINSTDKIMIGIPTKDRLKSLNRLMKSIYEQTVDNFDIMIIDDSKKDRLDADVELHEWMYKLSKKGIGVWVLRGKGINQVTAHNDIMDYAISKDYKLVYRVDDDLTLDPDNVEKLLNAMIKDKKYEYAAVGGMMYNPYKPLSEQQIPKDWRNQPQFKGNLNPCCYWAQVLQYPDDVIERNDIQHLHSSYIYRPELLKAIGGFPGGLSAVASREETLPLYELFLQGYKMKIMTKATAYHFHEQVGGCRSVEQEKAGECYTKDEQIFRERIKELEEKYKK